MKFLVWLRSHQGILLTLLAVAASLYAASLVGYVFGWLIGASKSPVVSAVAPLVFGLLGTLGFVSIGKALRSGHVVHASQALLAAGVVIAFAYYSWFGRYDGGQVRLQPYRSMSVLLGREWTATNAELRRDLYALRWAARRADLRASEFEDFCGDVLVPLLTDASLDPPARRAAIRAAIDELQPED